MTVKLGPSLKITFCWNPLLLFFSKKKERQSAGNYICFTQNFNLESLINECLPLWDDMRIQKGQSNESFKNLQEAQNYVRNFKKQK